MMLRSESVAAVLRDQLATIKPGDYIAFLNYIEETPETDRQFRAQKLNSRSHSTAPPLLAMDHAFLHSTGQLHKGGPDTGVFFQIIANDAVISPSPASPTLSLS
jgi:hypothetical protein